MARGELLQHEVARNLKCDVSHKEDRHGRLKLSPSEAKILFQAVETGISDVYPDNHNTPSANDTFDVGAKSEVQYLSKKLKQYSAITRGDQMKVHLAQQLPVTYRPFSLGGIES